MQKIAGTDNKRKLTPREREWQKMRERIDKEKGARKVRDISYTK